MKKSSFTGVDKCLKPLLKKGVERGVFSGAAVGLYKKSNEGEEKRFFCSGKTKNDTDAARINTKTLFDLASLTKPLCTALAIFHLVETKKITWKTNIDALFGTKTAFSLKKIEIAHLLSHSSGIKAYAPFYQDFLPVQKKENKKKLFASLLNEKPVYAAGKKCVYSDIGYMLLGEIVERVSGENLNDFFEKIITRPLGLEKQVLFRPLDAYGSVSNREIAATQYCPWRKRLLQGEVDDEHCWLMNGVSGHAGLFGTVKGVLDLSVYILNRWQGRVENVHNSFLQQALTRQYEDQTWCMGFDTPSQKGSSAGKHISANSVGHLGFTGTSFWIDPEKDMVIVLLTNRVHPTRENEEIKLFRPMLHDAIFEAMGYK